MSNVTTRTSGRAPRSFEALTAMHPLRPIHDEIELENAAEMIELLAGHDLNVDQEDYLEALSLLIESYEDKHHAIDLSNYEGIPALQALMTEQGMNQQDLARLLGIHKSHACKIMNGERSLTVAHLRQLASRFRVAPELFMS